MLITGSGKDDYSSSTQKQSIDTIATSRNTSLKQYKLTKAFNENAIKSPSLIGMGSFAQRFPDGSDLTNCHACLSSKVTNAKINIMSDCNINEIHLNIFPPSATYVKDPKNGCTNSSQVDDLPQSYLSIDVHEKTNQKNIKDSEASDGKRKVSLGSFSHISLKRCDSILHISIGNSSKITKRHKRNSWLFANLWKFAHKRKSLSQRKGFFSPQLSNDGIYRLSDRSLNLMNDNLMISINKRNFSDSSPSDNFTLHNDAFHNQNTLHNRDVSGNYRKNSDEVEIGANELDYYMSEIKRREMR